MARKFKSKKQRRVKDVFEQISKRNEEWVVYNYHIVYLFNYDYIVLVRIECSKHYKLRNSRIFVLFLHV